MLAVAATLPKPVTLVGTSLGGKVALQAAALQRDDAQRLVMLCSSALHTPRSERVYRWFELLCTEVDGALLDPSWWTPVGELRRAQVIDRFGAVIDLMYGA